LHFNAGLALLRLGQEERAAEAFKRVDDSSTEVFPDAMQILASLLVKRGDASEAKSALSRWIVVAPQKGEAVITSSKVLAGGGARGEARDLLESHMVGDQRIALELAGMLLQDGDLQAAGRIAAQAVG
jgi:thioredoxin-like negative regulator of GroEL